MTSSLYEREVSTAVQALPRPAAPLAVALVRECLTLPSAAYAPLLAGLEAWDDGTARMAYDVQAAGDVLVAAWHTAQDRQPGTEPDGTEWRVLDIMGAGQHAVAAMVFAMTLIRAGVEHVTPDAHGPTLH
jgi:hypothetical protein